MKIIKVNAKIRKSETILAIDPSINFAGYAVFKKGKPIDYGLINIGSKMKNTEYLVKAREVFKIMQKIRNKYDKPQVILEVPEFWGSGGFIARESGSVFKLTFLCGMLFTLGKVKTYTPSNWKGQMPKHVTANLLQEHYTKIDFKKLDHNIADAIGIGHKYLYGEL